MSKKLKVRMKANAAGPDGVYRAGKTEEVSEHDAVHFVHGKYATEVDPVPTLKEYEEREKAALETRATEEAKLEKAVRK